MEDLEMPETGIQACATLAFGLALAILPNAASAAGDEFRLTGGELKCLSADSGAAQGKDYMPCLRIGPIRVGATLRDVSMQFGRAAQTVNRGTITERVYPIRLDVPAGQRVPYWVIGFEGQRVVSVQITGGRPVDQFAFSSIRIGDPDARVIELFGSAGFTQPEPEIGAVMWGYDPYPVMFEIKDGKVYSIRVSEALGK
jgi:hypothetical protein